MKKNLYYNTVYKRSNSIRMGFLGFFLLISSWPRVFIENFTRKDLGRRYFNLSLCIFLTIVIALIPFGLARYNRNVIHVIGTNITWYAFLIAWVAVSWKRYKEIAYESGSFDNQKFTLSTGVIREQFFRLNWFGKVPSVRIVSTLYEPGLFFIAGLLLAMFGQILGFLFLICSVIYSLSWSAAFARGDEFIMNTMDEIIANEQNAATFMKEAPPEQTKGYQFFGRRPANAEFRRKVADAMIVDEPAAKVF